MIIKELFIYNAVDAQVRGMLPLIEEYEKVHGEVRVTCIDIYKS
ncbi:hypothetical protein [Sporanaerobium hydrogeniformans]|nr:hypothetical protein [Sporanaerobium hydrogeniformans]